jgi:hypothetical protein
MRRLAVQNLARRRSYKQCALIDTGMRIAIDYCNKGVRMMIFIVVFLACILVGLLDFIAESSLRKTNANIAKRMAAKETKNGQE